MPLAVSAPLIGEIQRIDQLTLAAAATCRSSHRYGQAEALNPSSCRDREADEVREAGCLVISCHWNALLTSALLLQVRWDTPRFVVQILAQSRLSKA
jgi:hypothetical protein